MRSRQLVLVTAAVAALVGSGSAAGSTATSLPDNGYVVFKESRLMSVTEVRAEGTGQVVYSASSLQAETAGTGECADSSFSFAGPRWSEFEPYLVNVRSTPPRIGPQATLADLVSAHEAWEPPFATHCESPRRTPSYDARYGGTTGRLASLATVLGVDGENVVAFQSLAGTVCDGATACVVLSYRNRTIEEADMALEEDLTRYGFADYWTTDDRTWWDDTGGRWAVSDVATHEFGHFAGLDHVERSPALTMFPFVHDGAQTLGRGDMLGLVALY